MLLKPIPHREMPLHACGYRACEEALVDLSTYIEGPLQIEMAYYRRRIKGAVPFCLMREGAARRLQRALRVLPKGYGFLIFDAWRPVSVQQALFDDYYIQITNSTEGRQLSASERIQRVRAFVSLPSFDPLHPCVHNTGGAVDLTLVGPNGRVLNMGTPFDDFSCAAHTDSFEGSGSTTIRDNRRLLYACMTAAGFTNLPSEWWHFDFGTAFWSYYTQKPAKYKGILKVGTEYEDEAEK